MATQTGSIDLSVTNAVHLAAQAEWASDLEDYATKSDLQVSADEILSTVSEDYAAKASLDDYATIEHVSSVVSQTSREFNIQFEEYESNLTTLGQTVDSLPTQDDIDAAVNGLVSDTDSRLAWLTVTTESGKPVLTLGTSETSYKARFDNEALTFKDGDTELATFGGIDGAHMPSAAVDTTLKIGTWIWEERSNGHLTLKYGG